MAKTVKYLDINGTALAPTKKHRAAIWECMLGTVYARDNAGKVKYFDYDYTAAYAHAGIADNRDIRVFKVTRKTLTGLAEGPRVGQRVVWMLPEISK